MFDDGFSGMILLRIGSERASGCLKDEEGSKALEGGITECRDGIDVRKTLLFLNSLAEVSQEDQSRC